MNPQSNLSRPRNRQEALALVETRIDQLSAEVAAIEDEEPDERSNFHRKIALSTVLHRVTSAVKTYEGFLR